MEAKPKEAPTPQPKDEEDDVPAYQEMVLFYLATGIKTALIAWCIAVITLAYIKLPDSKYWVGDQRIDATYAAGILGGLLGSLGVTVANGKKKDEKNNGGVSKKDIEAMISNSQSYQTIRVVTPLQINGAEVIEQKPKE